MQRAHFQKVALRIERDERESDFYGFAFGYERPALLMMFNLQQRPRIGYINAGVDMYGADSYWTWDFKLLDSSYTYSPEA